MIKKSILTTGIAVLLAVNLIGCNKQKDEDKKEAAELKAGQTLLTIQKDGTLNRKNVEEFNKDNYKLDDLKKAVNEEISDFNEKKGSSAKAVSLVNLQKDGKNVVLELKFKSANDYKKYVATYDSPDNKVIFYSGDSDEADIDKLKMPDQLKKADDSATVKTEDIIDEEGLKLVATNQEEKIEIDGEVKYMNDGATCEEGRVTGKKGTNTYVLYK